MGLLKAKLAKYRAQLLEPQGKSAAGKVRIRSRDQLPVKDRISKLKSVL